MIQKRKSIIKSITWFILFLILASLLFVSSHFIKQMMELSESDTISLFIFAIEAIGLIITVVIAVRQLHDSKEIARATFIAELNKSYIENPEYINIYNLLQRCYDGECANKDKCIQDGHCTLSDYSDNENQLKKSAISNYLTFFETIYLLHKRGVIGLDIIDDLFAYRFFLAVHSPIFQQEKLLTQPENFVNIFCLERDWLEYRKKLGKDDKSSGIFNQHLLKDEIEKKYGPNRYKELVSYANKRRNLS